MAVLTIFACVACCALPILTSLASTSVFALMAGWLKSSAVLLGAAVLIWTFFYRRRKTTQAACHTDCNCKPKRCGTAQASAN